MEIIHIYNNTYIFYRKEGVYTIEKRKINNIHNYNYLMRYKLYCKNKGLTEKSIEAICDMDLRIYLQWLDNRVITDVTHKDIQDFIIYCSEIRKNGSKAINRKYTNIKMFYKRLILNEDIDVKNPVERVEKPKIRSTVKPHLEVDEYMSIMQYLNDIKDYRGAALISLFFSSGCRLSEIWQQNKDSLDFTTKRFVVKGKGQKERIAIFNQDTSNYVIKYLKERNDDLRPLFISKYGTRWSKKAIQDYMKKIGIKVGMYKRLHPHLIRHGRAMQLLRSGAKLETIQRLLGHASIATSQIYAYMLIDDVQDEVYKYDIAI